MDFKAIRKSIAPTLTQDEFSVAIGLGLKTWHLWESGKKKPSKVMLNYICALDIIKEHTDILDLPS